MIKAVVIIFVLVFFAAMVIQSIRRPDSETIRRPIENSFSQFFQSVMAKIEFLVKFFLISSFVASLVNHSGQKEDTISLTFLIMIGVFVGIKFLSYIFSDDDDDE